jgi:hypothetical protein
MDYQRSERKRRIHEDHWVGGIPVLKLILAVNSPKFHSRLESALSVLEHYGFENVRDVFALVNRALHLGV